MRRSLATCTFLFSFLLAIDCYGQQFITIKGNQIQYETKGTGQPVVIFVHGYAGSLSSFDSVFDKVAAFTTAVRYSRAGLGKSSFDNQNKDFDTIVRELESVIDTLHISQPFVLVGHSYGGLIIRSYSRKHPKKIAGLLFDDATFEDYFDKLKPVNANAEALELREHEANKINFPSKGMDAEFKSMWRVWHSPEKWKGWFDAMPDVPTVVLTAMKITDTLLRSSQQAMAIRYEAQGRWLQGKPFRMQVGVADAGHLLHRDTPYIFTESVHLLIDVIRNRSAR